ncbi:metallophosphoesterase family protein [Candidatus Woesearchaeota archaeon]|nr:metallophosphoesterase family protein [Candidatus Woesearchaeota archaeon]
MKYGIISDVHRDPRIVSVAVDILKRGGAEKLILNGDIGERQGSLPASQDYVAVILDAVGKSGLESYVVRGSHETVGAFEPVLDYFKGKYPSLVDTFDCPKVEENGHHLVFLNGSDFVCGGEYHLGSNEEIPSGLYHINAGLLRYVNMNDLKRHVTDGEKTIIVCHVPRKFDSIDGAVDVAYFAESIADGSVIPGIVVEEMIRKQHGDVSDEEVKRIAAVNGLIFKEENRGNAELRDLYAELGITKAVSGHFHESGHRAHDGAVNPVPQETFVGELYWNSGQLDVGQTGILTVRDGKVSYQNLLLQQYLRG